MHPETSEMLHTFEVQPQVHYFCEVNAFSICNPPNLPFRALLRHAFLQQSLANCIRLYSVVQAAHDIYLDLAS